MGAGASLNPRRRYFLGLAVFGSQLPAVDEVLELLLVLVGMPVGFVPEDAALLDEVFEGRPRVPRGSEAQLSSGLRRGQGPAPAKEIHELRRQGRQPALSQRKRCQLETDRRQQRCMELARGVEERRQRLRAGRGDVVRTGRPALGGEVEGFDAVVAMDQLQSGVVTRNGGHELEIEVSGEWLRLVRIEAVAETQSEQIDARVADGEVRDVRLDL